MCFSDGYALLIEVWYAYAKSILVLILKAHEGRRCLRGQRLYDLLILLLFERFPVKIIVVFIIICGVAFGMIRLAGAVVLF